jgi:hypothetical protein
MKILTNIEEITDPRMIGKEQHNLSTIIFVALCGILSGCEDWKDIGSVIQVAFMRRSEQHPSIYVANHCYV